jgi:hypothetical protein
MSAFPLWKCPELYDSFKSYICKFNLFCFPLCFCYQMHCNSNRQIEYNLGGMCVRRAAYLHVISAPLSHPYSSPCQPGASCMMNKLSVSSLQTKPPCVCAPLLCHPHSFPPLLSLWPQLLSRHLRVSISFTYSPSVRLRKSSLTPLLDSLMEPCCNSPVLIVNLIPHPQ